MWKRYLFLNSRRGQSRWTFEQLAQAKSKKNTGIREQKSIDLKSYKPKRNESAIQQDLIQELNLIPYQGRMLGDFIYAIPNGGYRSKKTAAILKAEGVKSGVPDLNLIIASGGYHSLYIEMKTETGDLSDNQKHFISLLRSEGHKVVVCRDNGQAVSEIFKYLSGS